jgi:hypothetical protein
VRKSPIVDGLNRQTTYTYDTLGHRRELEVEPSRSRPSPVRSLCGMRAESRTSPGMELLVSSTESIRQLPRALATVQWLFKNTPMGNTDILLERTL